MARRVIVWFIAWKVIILLIAIFAIRVLPLQKQFILPQRNYFEFNHPYSPEHKLPYLAWVWGNFDGFYYTGIAKRGYFDTEQPFFPLYPVLTRGLTKLTNITYVLSAQIISNLALLLSLFIIAKLLKIDEKSSLIMLVAIILLFPTSLFYQAIYNDSLFFLLATLTIYFARKKNFLLAGLSGGLATLARLNGLALGFVLLFEYLTTKVDTWDIKQWPKGFDLKEIIRQKIYSIMLIPSAFIGYLVYVNYKFGSWTTVFSSMKAWGQDKITFPLVVFWRYFKIVFLHPTFKLNYYVSIIELGFVLFYVFLLFYSYKKIRFSYWIFFAVSLLIPALTGTFQGMPRYGLHLYPLFLSLALLLEKKNLFIKGLYFLISLSLLVLLTILFTRGYFVA